MKTQTKSAAISALKWAAGLTAGFIAGPVLIGLSGGSGLSSEKIAMKFIVGVVWFPILFFGLWAWGTFSKKDPLVSGHTSSTKTNANKKPSKWNYISIFAGICMLLFIFLPDIIEGTLAGNYYLGVIFWIVVITYCIRNILQARK